MVFIPILCLGIEARCPVCGALPTNAQAQARGTNGLAYDDLRTEPLLIAHLRQQVQGPQRDLTSAEDKGMGRAQTGLHSLLLGSRNGRT